MDTDQEQTAPEADDSSGTPAQTVRVPNVTPGAKSGLDHTVIGSDALTPPEDDSAETSGPAVPDGDLDSQIAWVADADDQDTARERADAVFQLAESEGADGGTLEALASALRVAVYGSAPDPGASIPGELVESETAGTGESVNAETGEVTPAGEPLPTIEQTEGTPLAPADQD